MHFRSFSIGNHPVVHTADQMLTRGTPEIFFEIRRIGRNLRRTDTQVDVQGHAEFKGECSIDHRRLPLEHRVVLGGEVEGAASVVVRFGLHVLGLVVELEPYATVDVSEGLAVIVADASFDLDPIQCFNRIAK